MRLPAILVAAAIAGAVAPASAQLALPPLGLPSSLPAIERLPDRLETTLDDTRVATQKMANELVNRRVDRLATLLRRHPADMAVDSAGNLARRDTLLLIDGSPDALAIIGAAAFTIVGSDRIESLDLDVTRIGIPAGMALADAERALRLLVPHATIAPDNLYLPAQGSMVRAAALPAGRGRATAPVGIIDGGATPHATISAMRGFARGGPRPSDHGAAIAFLLRHAGVQDIRVADVYGNDPAGGNALAIARGLGWLTGGGAKIVTVSLVGPPNALVEKAVKAARRKGVLIVAAVGNDGPAAPPAYPASYPGVIAVTGVDARNRALIEAGRATHLDYAAPGADLRTRNASGKGVRVRGTSFAAPLVAARAAFAVASRKGDVIGRLDAEAVDLGAKGPDRIYGRGLVCGRCRP